MSDRELLNNLNETCKKYIDDFLSFYTTLYEVKDEKKYSVDYVFSTALLLSTLKNDNISSRFFNKYGINYDNFLRKTDVKELDIVKFTKAENSKYLPIPDDDFDSIPAIACHALTSVSTVPI